MGQGTSTSCVLRSEELQSSKRRYGGHMGDTHPPQCPIFSPRVRQVANHGQEGRANAFPNYAPTARFVPRKDIVAGWTKPALRLTLGKNVTTTDTSSDSHSSTDSTTCSSRSSQPDPVRAAVRAAWECKFKLAEELIESTDQPRVQIWAAKTEIAFIRSLLTGKKCDIDSVLHCSMKVIETSTDSVADRTAVAEVTLWRGILQGLLGQKFRACWNIRGAFLLAKKLSKGDAQPRVRRVMGLVYLGIPMVSATYRPLLRLFGLDSDTPRGVAIIRAEADDGDLQCALVMALYHLHAEKKIDLAQEVLMHALAHTPKCPLLHWVASMCAWRLSNVDDGLFFLTKGLDCCSELESGPVYLQYELALLYFVQMRYDDAIRVLTHIHAMADEIVFPYRALLPVLLAACHWAGGCNAGDGFALEAVQVARSTLEVDLARVADRARSKRDAAGKSLFAVEVCYLLRLLPHLPSGILQRYRDKLLHKEVDGVSPSLSTCMLLGVLSFHLGDLTDARQVCRQLESALHDSMLQSDDAYYKAHGNYWCSRIWNELGDKERATSYALHAAKMGKRYSFDISPKVAAFAESIQ